MESPQIKSIDLLSMLRVAPLISSALSAMYSYSQYSFLKVFLNPHVGEDSSKNILPRYFDIFFRKGLKVVVSLNLITASSALASLIRTDGLAPNSPSRMWYWIGFGLTLSHYIFVPFVAYPIRNIIEDEPKGRSLDELRRWLKVHVIRSVLVDLPALACYTAGTLAMMKGPELEALTSM